MPPTRQIRRSQKSFRLIAGQPTGDADPSDVSGCFAGPDRGAASHFVGPEGETNLNLACHSIVEHLFNAILDVAGRRI